jgi:hypothetical protein
VIRDKIALLDGDWQVARFAPPFRGQHGADRLIDVAATLPYRSGAFEAIYARRIVEHLALDEAALFASELRRVLAPTGVVRISVPDTEALARAYLQAMERARQAPSTETLREARHARLLFIDQYVRRVPGGALAREILSGAMPARTVRAAFGDALGPRGEVTQGPLPARRPTLGQRVKEALRLLRGARWVSEPHAIREAHLWIYDRFSLPKLLKKAGFDDVREVDAATSSIAEWPRWDLDRSTLDTHDFEPSLTFEAQHG